MRFVRCPAAVSEYRYGSGDQGGAGRDQGDLPAGHAAGGDGVHRSVRADGAAAVGRRRGVGPLGIG